MSNRHDRYSDPLTDVQKRELKHKEYRPDGEKRHLEIISYGHAKLIDILSDDNATIFDKSIAKEEILRRLIKNQKRIENQKPKKSRHQKSRNKFKKTQKQYDGIHTGTEHIVKYDEFIKSGGDPQSCPFD